MADGDDPSKPTGGVIRRAGAAVAAAQAQRDAETAAVAEFISPQEVEPFDAVHLRQGDVLRVHVKNIQVVGSEQANSGPGGVYPRPWVVVSEKYSHRMPLNLVVAVPLTSQLHQQEKFRVARIAIPVEEMESIVDDWKPVTSLALTEQVRAIAVERCQKKIGRVSEQAVDSLRVGLRYILGL